MCLWILVYISLYIYRERERDSSIFSYDTKALRNSTYISFDKWIIYSLSLGHSTWICLGCSTGHWDPILPICTMLLLVFFFFIFLFFLGWFIFTMSQNFTQLYDVQSLSNYLECTLLFVQNYQTRKQGISLYLELYEISSGAENFKLGPNNCVKINSNHKCTLS